MHEGLSFKHYILTNFNCPDSYEHLEERFKIFNEYTLPSLENQTKKDFVWLINIRPEHQDMVKDFGGVNIEFINKNNEVGRSFIEFIRNVFEGTHLITTRLDNDDLLREDFVNLIHDLFARDQGDRIIDSNGYRMNRTGSHLIEFSMYNKTRNSPFSTAVKEIKDEINQEDMVICIKHGLLFTKFPRVEFTNQRMWIQHIHATNKLNKGLSGRKVNPNILQRFRPV